MKKKAKDKKEVIVKRPKHIKDPEAMLDLFLVSYPEAYDFGTKAAENVLTVMEEGSRGMNRFSPESICYWLNLASFANMVLKDIQFWGQFYRPEGYKPKENEDIVNITW